MCCETRPPGCTGQAQRAFASRCVRQHGERSGEEEPGAGPFGAVFIQASRCSAGEVTVQEGTWNLNKGFSALDPQRSYTIRHHQAPKFLPKGARALPGKRQPNEASVEF